MEAEDNWSVVPLNKKKQREIKKKKVEQARKELELKQAREAELASQEELSILELKRLQELADLKKYQAEAHLLIGDFIEYIGFKVPHVVNDILFKLESPLLLEQCRLVSSGWRDHIDGEKLLMRREMKPDGRIWNRKNLSVFVHKVVTMPPRHSVQDFSLDPNTNKLLLFHTYTCSKGHRHGCTTLYDQFLHCKTPFQFGAQDYNRTVSEYKYKCEHKYADHTKLMQKEAVNGMELNQDSGVLFLRDYVVCVEFGRVLVYHQECKTYAELVINRNYISAQHEIAKMGPFYPNGLVNYALHVEGMYNHVTLVRLSMDVVSDVGKNMNGSEEPLQAKDLLIRGPYSFGHGLGHGPGLQLLGRQGVVSAGLGNVHIFKSPQGPGEHLNLNKIDTSIYLKQENSTIDLCFLRYHLCKKYLMAVGQVYNREYIQAIRFYDISDGSTVWTKIYNYPKEKSISLSISNIFQNDQYVFWSISTMQKKNYVNILNCWNSANKTMMYSFSVPTLSPTETMRFMEQPCMQMGPNFVAIPMKHDKIGNQRTETFSLLVIEIFKNGNMNIIKQVRLSLNIGDSELDQEIKFFSDSGNIYFGNYSRPYAALNGPAFQLYSLSLKKRNNSQIPIDTRNTNLKNNMQILMAEVFDM